MEAPWLGRQLPEQADELIEKALELALSEDIDAGSDLTSGIIPPDLSVVANLLYREPAIVAGLDIFARVFKKVNPAIQISNFVEDGQAILSPDSVAALVRGPASGILTAERTALNFLQRMSGIASLTRKYVDIAGAHNIAILDTRKTTPGLRALEKYAVRAGGGFNHRFGLFDQILIKDNHVSLAGGVAQAIKLARLNHPGNLIEVEVTEVEEITQALEAGADLIMLDNMNPGQIRKAVDMIQGLALIEVSGGINLSNIREYLIPGVDAISIGALTHSCPSIDISLEVKV